MFQLLLPHTRARPRGPCIRRKKGKLFGRNSTMPCVYCGCILTFKEATVEHIIPIGKGGPDIIENLTISCKPCNNHRHDIPFDEWKKIARYDKLVRHLIKYHRIIGRCMI